MLLLALTPSLCVLSLSAGMPHLGRLQDDGLYWIGAKSLAEGSGYRITSLPGEPFQTKYPPLFPFLLSLVWRVFPAYPENLGVAAALSWLFLPVMLLLSRRLYSGLGLTNPRNWLLILLLGWSPAVAYLGTTLMPELLLACLLLASLSLSERAGDSDSRGWLAFTAGLLAGGAFLTKTAAIPILISSPLCLLLRRRRRHAVLFLCGMLPVTLLWLLWVLTHRAEGTDVVTLYYTNYVGYHLHNFSVSRLPLMLWKNANGLLAGIGGLLVTNLSDAEWLKALCRILGLLSLFGLIRMLRRTSGVHYVWFALCYMLMLLLWHFPPNERFLVPVLPILLAGLAGELTFHAGLVKRSLQGADIAQRTVSVLLAAVFAGLCLTALGTGVEAYLRHLPRFFASERAQLAEERRLYAWISANTPDDATFLAYRDTRIALDAGRRAIRLIVPPALYYDGDEAATDHYFRSLDGFARRYGITHVVVSAADGYSLNSPDRGFAIVRQITSDERRFQPQYRSPLVVLYKVGQ